MGPPSQAGPPAYTAPLFSISRSHGGRASGSPLVWTAGTGYASALKMCAAPVVMTTMAMMMIMLMMTMTVAIAMMKKVTVILVRMNM